GGQGAGGTVEDVVEFVDRCEDALPGGRGHRIVAVQYARHRRGGDLRTGRHVRQGHRHVSSSASCASSYAAVRRRPHRVPGPPGPRLRPDDRDIRRVVRPLEQSGLRGVLSPEPRGGRMLPARKAIAATSAGPRPLQWSAGQLVGAGRAGARGARTAYEGNVVTRQTVRIAASGPAPRTCTPPANASRTPSPNSPPTPPTAESAWPSNPSTPCTPPRSEERRVGQEGRSPGA